MPGIKVQYKYKPTLHLSQMPFLYYECPASFDIRSDRNDTPYYTLRSSLLQPPSLCSAYQDIVNWNMDELNQISNCAHYKETNANSLRNLDKLPAIRLCASVNELRAISDEIPWDIQELLNLVGHVWLIWRAWLIVRRARSRFEFCSITRYIDFCYVKIFQDIQTR